MKDKKTGLIQTLIGAIILVIGIVLCVNTYIVKGNKAYAFSLLVTILGIVILIAGLYRTFSKKKRKPVDAKVIAQAALCAALCYVGATFIKIDIPVGTKEPCSTLVMYSAFLQLYLSVANGVVLPEQSV